MYNGNDTVVSWFIKEQFCNLHVWFMFIRVINPPLKNTLRVSAGPRMSLVEDENLDYKRMRVGEIRC
jgi:hypothetical protein